MKKIYKYLMLAIVAVFGLSLTSCKDDETTMSRKVLASVQVMEYDGEDPDIQIIRVTSDGDWVAEAPEWISVNPASGTTGQTEVEIQVTKNYRDGALDNPRRGNVLFKGRNLESIATVLVKQSGDKFRDIQDYTISSLNGVSNETVVNLPNLVVASLTGTGFVATDGNMFMYIRDAVSQPAVGDMVTVSGEKYTDDKKMVYVLGERVAVNGTGSISEVEPIDITDNIDTMDSKTYDFVTFTGAYDGSSMKVGNNVSMVYLIDAPESMDLKEMMGHQLQIKGFYAGYAYPSMNVIPVEIIDLGVNEVIYFIDNFEWMDPWAVAAGVHDYVAESETVAAESKNIAQENADGKKLIDELYERGYDFVKATFEGKEDRPFETRIYFQKNYLKFSLTGIEAGVVLPKLKDIPAGEKIELCFDWSPMRQGSVGAANRKYDAINLVVIVDNGDGETQVPVPPHTLVQGGEHKWMNAVIDLSKFDINENTKITIRSSDDRWPTDVVNRWFFDNLKIRQKK